MTKKTYLSPITDVVAMTTVGPAIMAGSDGTVSTPIAGGNETPPGGWTPSGSRRRGWSDDDE